MYAMLHTLKLVWGQFHANVDNEQMKPSEVTEALVYLQSTVIFSNKFMWLKCAI